MARLIDADEVMEIVKAHCYPLATRHNSIDDGMFVAGIQQAVDECSTIDAAPMVHGAKITRLNDVFSEKIITVCSECSGRVGKRDAYCRHCGAKMDMDDSED